MTSSHVFQAPVGTRDVLPPESARWETLIATFSQRARRAGFGLVHTPVFEHAEVFHRIGEGSDVVRKEMYDFEDKGGRRLALRPEGTAPVVRAFVQHKPPVPWKVWYLATHLRYERPQKGRYRQHHQLGVEVMGVDDPDVDVEVIALAEGFYRELGLRQYTLSINSLGDADCRPAYVDALREWLRERRDDLSADAQERLELNPLRVLDSKRERDVEVTTGAPMMIDHLSEASKEHFDRVRRGLDALGIPYVVDPRLVRGLDYYTRTAFEFASDAIDAAQNAIGGGGRYDGLVEAMGGPPTPGIGFGIGIERLLIAADAEGVVPTPEATADVFVVDGMRDGSAEALVVLHELRDAGYVAERATGGRSFKGQMKAANSSGAAFAVVVGQQEAEEGVVAVKDMESGEQTKVPRAELVAYLQERIRP
jgi:histidyl-tRNA synthetase